MKESSKSPKPNDILRRAKDVGYCWACLPPENEAGFAEFVDYAKFQLCRRTNRLMKDPVWEEYSDIEVLAEYFAWIYATDDKAKERRESEMGMDEDMYDWFDRMIEKNKQEMEEMAEGLEDINFDPSTVMGN